MLFHMDNLARFDTTQVEQILNNFFQHIGLFINDGKELRLLFDT